MSLFLQAFVLVLVLSFTRMWLPGEGCSELRNLKPESLNVSPPLPTWFATSAWMLLGAVSPSRAHGEGPTLHACACCLSFLLDGSQTPPFGKRFLPPASGLTPLPSHLLNVPPLFASCRDFDSLSKDNVFENNRLVSPQTYDSPRSRGGWGLAGQELRGCSFPRPLLP